MTEEGGSDPALGFFHDIVEPTVAEFLHQPHDTRLGLLACLTLASMSDHYFHARPRDVAPCRQPGHFRGMLKDAHFAFRQVADIANATKHVQPLPGRAALQHMSEQDVTVGLLRAGWPINGRMVMLEVRPGEWWLLSDLVQAATDMWREKLGLAPGSAAT
jgi:hypothetical protein